MLDKKFFDRVGLRVRDKYRKHIFEKAKDVFGNTFKGYSQEYGEQKRANEFKRQMSKYANSTAPVLTGDLLRDYSLIKTSNNGFQIGWSTFGLVVKSLKKQGRVLTDPIQPLPKGVMNYLSLKAHKYIGKKSDDIIGSKKSKTHRVGKK